MNTFLEAAVRRCSSKIGALKVLQYCKLKRDFKAGVFLGILPSFYEQLFYITPPVAASAFFQK